MRLNQRGMTLIGFVLVLGMVGVFIYMGMKAIPMYSEYYSVKQALASMAKEDMSRKDPQSIRDAFFRRMDINYGQNITDKDVKLSRQAEGWLMTVEYEVRKPLIANLDVVGHFKAEQELRRSID